MKDIMTINEIYDCFDITEEEIVIFENMNEAFNQYVYGMPTITGSEINKVFKKEKKLKLPDLSIQDSKLVYLGWIDESTRKLLITYNMDGKLLGMACRLTSSKRIVLISALFVTI